MSEKSHEAIRQVREIIRQSNLWKPTDPPETVATLILLVFTKHTSTPLSKVPRLLKCALDEIGEDDGAGE